MLPEAHEVNQINEVKEVDQVNEVEQVEEDQTTQYPSQPTSEEYFDNEENLKLWKQARETAQMLEDRLESDNWELVKEEDDMKVYKTDSDKGQVVCKRLATINANIDVCVEKLKDLDIYKQMNDRIEKIEVIKEISTKSSLIYQKMKGMLVVSPRDLCYIKTHFPLRNGNHVVIDASVEHSECPEVNKVVRAGTKNFYMLKRISDDQTELLNYLNIDLKGSIPNFVISKISQKQFDSLKKLQSILESA